MKKVAKKIAQFVNRDCLNIYLKLYYKRQLRNKFLIKSDYIDDKYKKDIKQYWNQFSIKINNDWHKWYSSRNGIKDVRYIPENIFYCYIEPYYNRSDFCKAYEDKGLTNLWFPNIKRPRTIAKNMSGVCYDDELNPIFEEEIIKKCISREKIIIKPTIESGGGRNVCFIDSKDSCNIKQEIINAITEFKQDYIIQEVLEQHEDLKRINPESVNTLRIMSFFFKGKVHILSSILRMGINASKVDNESAGGISCGISEYGKLCRYAFDRYGKFFERHPQGFLFENSVVPSYSDVIDIIKQEHIKLGHFKLISWDFAISSDGAPVLIEYNLRFQGINFLQMDNGPLFGKLTDEVLEDVFGRR
ncbi:sugar-transfer associated ATP-grasp domain-containing protein [Haloimpatiens sp. FM7330]|uniref:sugar-transfer associated ATP-grasp domain-containing protein n=1 Tax=Haloimpatiens sp. FM7330 TaxID=3298610 RepID=UPI00363FC733